MKLWSILALCFLLYLSFIIPKIDTPLTYDELHWVIGAETLIQTGKAVGCMGESVEAQWSPPLHLKLQAFLFRLIGISNISSRLIGIVSILFQLVLFYFFGKTLFEKFNDQWKFLLLSSLIFVTNPAVIQGSLISTNDTTLLPVFLTLLALVFLKFSKQIDLMGTLVLCVIFAVSLWEKLTTPFVMILSMSVYYLFNRNSRGVIRTAMILALGILLFFASWSTYAVLKGLDAFGPINYAISSFSSQRVCRQAGTVLFGFSTTVARFILWFGLYSLLPVVVVLILRILNFTRKKICEPVDFLVIYVILVGIGYILVGGTPFGFPKYHYPIFSVAAVLSAFAYGNLWKKVSVKEVVLYFVMGILTFGYFCFFFGDPIYIFNFSLREAVVNDIAGVKDILLHLGCRFGAYLLPSIPVFLIISGYRKSYKFTARVLITAIIMMFAANFSLNLIQRKAVYSTGYCYGEEGTEDLIGYLDRHLGPGEIVLATEDIVYYLRRRGKDTPYLPPEIWNNLHTIKKIVDDPSVKFVIYSIGHNSIDQFKNVVLKPDFILDLKGHFVLKEIGTYKVWKRS